MTIRKINGLNIGLILVSALCAFRFPLETFLAAYAFLGPLHYLTEISWLERKGYFLAKAKLAWVFVGLCLLIFPVAYLIPRMSWLVVPAILLAFAAGWRLIRQKRSWIDGGVPLFIVLLYLSYTVSPVIAFLLAAIAVLLPTIVHVSVFTGLFMVGGALREKGWSGWLAFGVFVISSTTLFLSGSFFPDWNVTRSLLPLYQNFLEMQSVLVNGLGAQNNELTHLFYSPVGLGVMRFVGFAYLYHYLNWFSKTSIIQWHAISKARIGLIVSIWLATVALYSVNYQAGFLAMLFLSLLHVFLEFPLNWKTMGMIAGSLKRSAD